MQIVAVQNKNISSAVTNKKNNNQNDSEFKNAVKTVAITGGATALAAGADLFITKGRAISGLTRGKVSFIKTMSEEIDNVVKQDSYATKNRLEAFLCTPGLHAVWNHRVAHKLDEWKVPVLPRLISNISRFLTGIEIHPGAKIGKNVFIDHNGAIIGQTAIVEDGATLVGRVTLATNGTGRDGFFRHPTVKKGATVGMNAVIMGGKTVVGENAIVGASAVVNRSVPQGATVVNNSRPTVIRHNGEKIEPPVLLKDFIPSSVKN